MAIHVDKYSHKIVGKHCLRHDATFPHGQNGIGNSQDLQDFVLTELSLCDLMPGMIKISRHALACGFWFNRGLAPSG